MIISSADGNCNNLNFTIPTPWFDDHTVRTEHHLQKRLRQRAPMTVNGGREILWRCSCCRKPCYQAGYSSYFVSLSTEQRFTIAQRVGADASIVSWLPTSICAAIHPGRMPRIKEYRIRRGYQFTWTGRKSPYPHLFCIIEKNTCSIQSVPVASFATPGDVVLSPLKQVRRILHWLMILAEPEGDEAMLVSESTCDLLNRRDRLEPGLAWCGYCWKTQCPTLGNALVALEMTFPSFAAYSLRFLVACWRQVARKRERVL